MRTIALISLIATHTSCKEYQCKCDMTYTGGNYAGFTTNSNGIDASIKTNSKKKAKAFCKKVEAQQIANGNTGTCTLK